MSGLRTHSPLPAPSLGKADAYPHWHAARQRHLILFRRPPKNLTWFVAVGMHSYRKPPLEDVSCFRRRPLALIQRALSFGSERAQREAIPSDVRGRLWLSAHAWSPSSAQTRTPRGQLSVFAGKLRIFAKLPPGRESSSAGPHIKSGCFLPLQS